MRRAELLLFFFEEQKRRISKDYCRDEGPKSVYWAVGLVRGQVGFNGKVPINELWKDIGRKGLVRLFEEKCLIGQVK